MKLPETIDYWAKMRDPNDVAEDAAVALAREVQRLQREASRHIEALEHYDAWFGDECGCSDDPCPIATWGTPPPAPRPQHCRCPACKDGTIHHSDCAVHADESAEQKPCSCGVLVCDKCGGPYDGGCLVCGNPNGESAPCETIIERRNYTLTTEQYEALFQACRPVPYMVVGGTVPSSPQQNANRAWQQLGQEMGFDWETVERGRIPQRFSAVPTR